jgi:hypothetical protein
MDQGHVGALMLLDLSAAFDTADHRILDDVMRRRFGVCGSALDWLADFLKDRTQIVRVGGSESAASTLQYGVPQGSVHGPKRFIEYAEDVTCQLVKNDLVHHLFADDTQGMLHCLPADVPLMMSKLNECFVDVSGWCASKRLQLNENKTELLIFGTAASLKKIPLGSDVMQAGSSVIESADAVRDLGVILDAQLTMRDHVSRTAQACFFHLRRLRPVRQLLGRDVTIQLVTALVFSRLDYCNAVLAGLPASTLAPLQRVLHAAARLVNCLRPRYHVTSALKELHWLPIVQRIDYKLCLLVHKSIMATPRRT